MVRMVQKAVAERRGESAYHTRAVSRALQILTSFTAQDLELSVAQLNEKLDIHKSTLVRLLQCMADERFIEHNPATGRYRLGIRMFEIGSLYQRTRMMNLGPLARPFMLRLAIKFGVSVNLAIRDQTEIVYVETVEPVGSPVRVAYSVGDRFGIHHTSLGKAIVAFLPAEELGDLLAKLKLTPLTPCSITQVEVLEQELEHVRECGYAVDDEESLPGLRCVGAPIWNNQSVVAALSVSSSTLVVTKERIAEIAAAVKETAQEIGALLGATPR